MVVNYGCLAIKRYPTPDSVSKYWGRLGSCSIFFLIWAIKTLKYCDWLINPGPHTARKRYWCVSTLPSFLANKEIKLYSVFVSLSSSPFFLTVLVNKSICKSSALMIGSISSVTILRNDDLSLSNNYTVLKGL